MSIKNIINCLFFFIASSAFVSCEKEINGDDYNKTSPEYLPSIAMQADSVSFDGVLLNIQMSLNSDEELQEQGILISSDPSFAAGATRVETFDSIHIDHQFLATRLLGSTPYYFKSYTYSKNGFAFSDVVNITTEEPPVFEDTYLFGTFNQINHSMKYGIVDGSESGYWNAFGPMTIEQVKGTYNQISIFNFWGYGRTIIAELNFEDKTLEISPQEIAEFDKNGPLSIYKWSMDASNNILIHLEENVQGHYDENGNITIDMWGGFAYNDGYYVYDFCTETHLIKQIDEEVEVEEEENTTKSIKVKNRLRIDSNLELPILIK